MSPETVTLLLVNIAGILERADESLLPGVYKEVGAALNIDPTGLGSLTLFRCIVQSSCYPLAAYLATRHDRTFVIAIGAYLWAAATFLVAFSSTFFQVAVSRALNGVGLAIVIPAIQSLVADSTEESTRGMAFGWLQLTGNMGAILGSICSVMIASTSFMGIPGWRLAFHLVGIISVAVGILVQLFANDSRFANKPRSECVITNTPFCSELKEVLLEAKSVIRIPSFQIIVAQGVAGTFPWSGLSSFAPMWLELIGFSHETTAFLITMYVVGNSLGGLFGGKMGDILSKRLPNCGRIILSQISSGSAIPLAAILFLGLPNDPSSSFKYGLVLFIMGLTTSWNAPATNNPIFAEIVPEKHRTSIYALDCSFESILNSFAPPLVGILAQHVYGYKPIPEGSSESAVIETDRENATALAKALNINFTITMTVCCAIYSFLYCTYPRDRERARMQSLVESESQLMEGTSHSYKLPFSKLEKQDVEDETVMTAEYEGDKNDEKSLLATQVHV
ncbi:hypothetical protein SOVF_086540 [Spinacia oleracea]|uniref:Uncharacterized protein LOC110791059 n=1 Tax=Spinacia oleracea TaxID=3562 RepID=A0A9R0JY95_SPIOL|nr:uncharacterized protein LOC110791059 [Spinacia oleracea]XP_056696794.1 uncharacterized protein LOC110791059 [Spinacia oleracea]KNA16716.1 hypothetical protein SOVF_086540 [Spinacia oleracea]